MQIIISGKGVKLTDALKNYAEKKIEGLEKFFPGLIRAEVLLGMENHSHTKGNVFFAECKLEVPGHDVFMKKQAQSEYQAVDILRDQMETELKKHKAKMRGNEKRKKSASRENKEYQENN